jgi:hypothetical protein
MSFSYGFIPVRALLGHANVEETSRFLGLETNSNPTRLRLMDGRTDLNAAREAGPIFRGVGKRVD